MIKFEETDAWGFEGAIRGMRNPLNSHDKSDSGYFGSSVGHKNYIIGEKDLELCQRLIVGGSEHRKFLRQIFVSVDITAPLYWWKEFDTYKVGTTANSCSTMHTLMKFPITKDNFSFDDVPNDLMIALQYPGKYFDKDGISELTDLLIEYLEALRVAWNNEKDIKTKRYIWKLIIQTLPESWNQKRTVTMDYENLRSMYFQRRNHKLDEWREGFVEWVKTLPYAKELIIFDGTNEKET